MYFIMPSSPRASLFASDVGRAIDELETAFAPANPRPMWQAELCFARARSGHRSVAEAILAGLTSPAEGAYVSPYDLALCAARLEDWGAALDHLEGAYQDRVMIPTSMACAGNPAL